MAAAATAADWPAFRGANGSGVSAEGNVPFEWSDNKNLKWKTPLPGPGSSSPILCGPNVFLTCYTGYGTGNGGTAEQLQRHLLCVNRNDGKIRWTASVAATLPEDSYSGYLTQHGYASSTPVTDGQRVYVFFGKSGALAFDLEGKRLWQVNLGQESSNRRWGSAASPILYKDLLIVNASEESQSIRALKRETGEEVWKAEAAALELTFATPLLVDLPDGRKELVVGVPYEAWGLNPDNGKLSWYAETDLDGNISPSPVAKDGVVYIFGGFRNTGSTAIRAGGKGDVTESHVLWTSRDASYVPSPVISGKHLYWVSDMGIAYCMEAATSKLRYRERLPRIGGGFGSKPVYASPVLVGDRLICVTRTGGTFVLAAKPAFEQVASNRFASDESDFNASPAVGDGQVFLRSNRFLYCIEADAAE